MNTSSILQQNIFMVTLLLIMLSIIYVIWRKYYNGYLKEKANKVKYFIPMIKISKYVGNIALVCAILLINSDEEISKALKYVKPSKHTDNLLEKLYGQNRI